MMSGNRRPTCSPPVLRSGRAALSQQSVDKLSTGQPRLFRLMASGVFQGARNIRLRGAAPVGDVTDFVSFIRRFRPIRRRRSNARRGLPDVQHSLHADAQGRASRSSLDGRPRSSFYGLMATSVIRTAQYFPRRRARFLTTSPSRRRVTNFYVKLPVRQALSGPRNWPSRPGLNFRRFLVPGARAPFAARCIQTEDKVQNLSINFSGPPLLRP